MKVTITIGKVFVERDDFACLFLGAFFDFDFFFICFLDEVFFGFLLIVILR